MMNYRLGIKKRRTSGKNLKLIEISRSRRLKNKESLKGNREPKNLRLQKRLLKRQRMTMISLLMEMMMLKNQLNQLRLSHLPQKSQLLSRLMVTLMMSS